MVVASHRSSGVSGRLLLTAALALSLALAGCATPKIFAQSGVQGTQTIADERACKDIAIKGGDTAPGYTGGTAAGSLGAGIGAGVADVMRQRDYVDSCMKAKGYSLLSITDDEWSKLKSMDKASDAPYRQQLLDKYVGAATAQRPEQR